MPCESCAVQFSVFKRKRPCSECERFYCTGCLRRGGGTMCAPCRVLSTRPLFRQTIAHLKVRDLQCFLRHQNVSTRGCVEKEELLNLCISHVNSSAYRRHGPRVGASPFTTLKGITNNINEFITSTFDLRNTGQQATQPDRSNCYNAAHSHSQSGLETSESNGNFNDRRFTPTPGGERDIRVPPPPPAPVTRSASSESTRVDTTDCFEIEDLEEFGWEFVTPPAEPLPTDSAVLIAEGQTEGRSGGLSASEPDLSRAEADARAETGSLQDEPPGASEGDGAEDAAGESGRAGPPPVSLERLRRASELEALTVRQLKELLVRNRVEFRGCLERAELLQRARMLLDEHARCQAEVEREECCKICWAAPLECVLLECGHIATCTGCAKRLADCPICRQYVVRAVRFFRS